MQRLYGRQKVVLGLAPFRTKKPYNTSIMDQLEQKRILFRQSSDETGGLVNLDRENTRFNAVL